MRPRSTSTTSASSHRPWNCARPPAPSPDSSAATRQACGSRPKRWPRTAASAVLRQQRKHPLHVVDEAHVEHAIGFVEHQDLHVPQIERALAEWSSSRPGVATRMSTPRLSSSICGFMQRHRRSSRRWPCCACRRSRTLSPTCAASSRVGVRISTRTGCAICRAARAARLGAAASAARSRRSCRCRFVRRRAGRRR